MFFDLSDPKSRDPFFMIDKDDPKKTKAKINVIDIPITIIKPKSIIGFISLTIKDAKAAIVVRAV